MAPEHSPLWEHFRNIDLDKEAKVLQVRCCWLLVAFSASRTVLCNLRIGVHKQAIVLWLSCRGAVSCLP
jgi:hypothetical protein